MGYQHLHPGLNRLSKLAWLAVFSVSLYFGALSHVGIHGRPDVFFKDLELDDAAEDRIRPILESLEADLEGLEKRLDACKGSHTTFCTTGLSRMRRQVANHTEFLRDTNFFTPDGLAKLSAERGGEANISRLLQNLHANASFGRIAFRILLLALFIIFPNSAYATFFLVSHANPSSLLNVVLQAYNLV